MPPLSNIHEDQQETLRRASRTINFAENEGLFVDADMGSVTNAKAAIDVAEAAKHIADRNLGVHVKRAIDVHASQKRDSHPGGTAQVETATVVAAAGITGNGNIDVLITAVGMTGSILQVTVAVTIAAHTTAALIAAAIVANLKATANFAAFFDVVASGATIVATAKNALANDGTMNIDLNLTASTATGFSDAPTSTNTTAGVAPTIALLRADLPAAGGLTDRMIS